MTLSICHACSSSSAAPATVTPFARLLCAWWIPLCSHVSLARIVDSHFVTARYCYLTLILVNYERFALIGAYLVDKASTTGVSLSLSSAAMREDQRMQASLRPCSRCALHAYSESSAKWCSYSQTQLAMAADLVTKPPHRSLTFHVHPLNYPFGHLIPLCFVQRVDKHGACR